MPRRRFSHFRTLPALFTFVLAVLALAAAPALAAGARLHPHDMAAAMMGGPDKPCPEMAGKADHTFGKHAGNCLATCLAGHGALMPAMPSTELAWLHPAALPEAPLVRALRARPSSLDPPPPRQS